jgi:hypothetical protein
MDPVVTIDSANVSVEPGGQATVRVKVRNRSGIVEGFNLDVVGEPAGWAQLYPAELEVRPQEEAETVVIFSPPAGASSRAGQVPFGVRAVSRVDPSSAAVAEGDLAVGSVALSQATIRPVTSKGRFSAKHRIEMSNWGNEPVRLALEVTDPDEAMGFLLTPDVLDLPIGTTGRAKLKLRARKPFFRGAPQRRAFRVVGRPIAPGAFGPEVGPTQQFGYDPTQPAVDGAFEQRAILGGAVIPFAVTAIVLAGLIGWLSTRGNDDPGTETRRPATPESFQAASIASDSVQLRWQPLERVDGYKVVTFDPETAGDEENPTPQDVVEEAVDADQGSFTVPELAPGTPYCFGLAAVRGEVASPYSDPLCLTTSPQGAPPPPGEVAAELTDDGKARVSWQDTSDGEANHLIVRDGSVVGVIPAPGAEGVVDLGGENCFQVMSELEDIRSAETPEPCIRLDPAAEGGGSGGGGAGGDGGGGGPVVGGAGGGPGTTDGEGEGGGGSGGGLGWIAIVGNVPVDDVDAETRVASRVEELRSGDHPEASFLNSSDYPNLEGVLPGNYVIYIPGFDSRAEVDEFCVDSGFRSRGGCLPADLSADAGTTSTTER